MVKYIIVRILTMLLTLFLIISFVYISGRLVMLKVWSPTTDFSDDVMLTLTQYKDFLVAIFTHWDWGQTARRQDAWLLVADKVSISLKVNFTVFFIYLFFGWFLGILSAMKRHSLIDNIIGLFVMIFSSLPSLILIFPLTLLLGYRWAVLPGQFPLGVLSRGFWHTMSGLIIPVLALSGQPIANLTRMVRGELIETMESDFMLLARVKGLNRNQTLLRHGLRNSLIPIMPEIPSTFIYILINSFFVEIFYGIPGLARLFLNSIYAPIYDSGYVQIDTNVIVLISAFYAIIGLTASLVIDVLYSVVDPRVRVGSKK